MKGVKPQNTHIALKKLEWIIICFLLMLTYPCKAQDDDRVVIEQEQFWFSVNSHSRISSRVGILADFHLRRTDFLDETNFYFIRTGVSWRFSDQLFIAAGYGHLWLSRDFQTASGIYQDENRIYQDLQWKARAGRVTFLNRFRNEQRWHEVLNEEGQYDRTRFSNRIRFLSSFTFRIFNNPQLPALIVSDEIMFHFGKEIEYNTFDQNRLFTGIKVPVAKDLNFDFGYMLVYQQHYDGFTYDLNHTLRWFFFYSPDLRKIK
jgi:hypothetical protein